MKAMLIIELDDEWLNKTNINYDEMFADVTIYKKESLENQCDYSQRLYRCWCPLKHLPEKKHNNGGYRVIDGTKWFYDSEHDDGWNDCIEEILGEADNE